MFNELWEMGVTQGLGVFFFLFLGLCAFFFWFFKESKKENKELVNRVMQENLAREQRYIDTIDKLSDSDENLKQIKTEVGQIRKELEEGHKRQESMIGRVLDRLPVKS